MTLLSSIFYHNQLAFTSFDDASVTQPSNWNIGIMLVLLMLLAAVVASSRGKVLQLAKAFVVPRHFSLVLREGKIMEQRAFRFLLIFDILTIALGVTTLVELYKPELIARFTYPVCYGAAILALFLLHLVKVLLQNLYVYLFDRQKEKYNLHLHKFIYTTVAALIMYVFLALVIFSRFLPLINIYFIVLALITVLFFYNLYKINPRGFNLFQFFIYFCTLEILPWVIMASFIVKY
ncbi:MAG: DUF4271 domain-containing protein [Bacteroidales bacterium]|nr:DUF4271 domain-containing protein [Bacteroidales bacterium]